MARVRRLTEGRFAIAALVAFAAWIFVALPLYYGPRDDTASAKCSSKEEKDYGFWEKARCEPATYFTAWLVAFTGVLAVSTIGLWWVTWRSGVRQPRDMRAALGHAEKALATAERAFVFIDGFNVELTTAADDPAQDFSGIPEWYRRHPDLWIARFAAQPRWRNGGNTPTRQLTVQCDCQVFREGFPEGFGYPYRHAPAAFLLPPRAIEPGASLEIPPAQALIEYENSQVGVAPIILIWGRADYIDVFNNSHFIEWCYLLPLPHPGPSERMSAQFIQWGSYNRADS